MVRTLCPKLRAAAAIVAAGLLASSCDGDDEGDGDVLEDADVEETDAPDSDGDRDADGETDHEVAADADADADQDVDEERDLRRCGDGTGTCWSCHGTEASAAPPPDTSGLTDPAEPTVGSHAAHLAGGAFADAVDCSECHAVPGDVLDRGHCDSLPPADVTFGDLATADGTFPMWSRDSASCSMVYCHGATLEGGSDTSPSWTGPGVTCGSCHSRTYHGQRSCDCHSSVWSGGEIVSPELHVNGRVDM